MNETTNTEQKPADGSPLDGGVVPLVVRLREDAALAQHCYGFHNALLTEAADEIERLHKELGECSGGFESGTKAIVENRALRDFANAVLGGWPDHICIDGFELQDHAVKHGLLALKDPKPTAPCGEFCNCVEYHGSDPADWAAGVDCYVKTALLRHNVLVSRQGGATDDRK